MKNGDHQLALDILRSLDIAVLLRTGPKQYEFFGEAPAFYEKIFPGANNAPCTAPWEHSSMLEFFIEDAELFFSKHSPGALSSGVWQEDGKTDDDSALIAVATIFGRAEVIIIRVLQQDYSERVGILRKAREQLLENRELSHHLALYKEKSQLDGLTGIFNRATFGELLPEAIKTSNAGPSDLALIMLDIDNFKSVNDTYGHLAGDEVLRTLGRHLHESFRRHDIVARYGGEEFVVLMSGSGQEQTLRAAEKLRKSFKKIQIAGLPVITVSLGCTLYRHGESAEQFIQRADIALYDAKHSGKDCVRMR